METTQAAPDVLRSTCQSREVLDLIADKWTVLVLCALEGDRLRFTDLRRRIDGVSPKVLTHTLRAMERNGVVTRTVLATVPPHVDYELTPLGLTLQASVNCLRRWAEAHMEDVRAAQAAYDASTSG